MFLFFPIVIILLYAFNASNVQSWPPPGLSTRWFSSTWHNAEVRQALWLSVRAGLIACTGNTGCKFALSNTKDTAMASVKFAETSPEPPLEKLYDYICVP